MDEPLEVTGSAPTLNIHLRQLAYLRAVDRHGTMTRAALALGVSQPALSQSLADLERRLGVTLFEAAGRGRQLTADGREVVAFAESVLAGAAELQERLSARAAGDEGPLRVGMIDAASLYVLPRTIQRYRADHPQVELGLYVDTSTELVRRLRAFELDLVFVVGPAEPDLRGDEVLREALYVYAPPGELAEQPQLATDWVLYPEGSRTRAIIDAGLARLGVRPRIALESHNPEVLRQMVALGLGWSVLPPAVAEDAGELRAHRGVQVAERALVGVRRTVAQPRVEAFLRLALEPS